MRAVAGDFYDFLAIDERRVGVLVADVTGHGVPAALIASMLKVAFAGQGAHATVVHGCAIAHTAEAMPPRLPGHAKLAHEESKRCACLRSRPQTGQCSG